MRLPGRKILLVEDEYIIARDLAEALERQGARVIGPVARLDAAMALVDGHDDLAGAVLDVKLHGAQVYPIAEALRRRGVPFLFATGYDQQEIPLAFRDVPHCEKPVSTSAIVTALARMLERQIGAVTG